MTASAAGLATPTAATVAVNYYGAVATLESLRPLLAFRTSEETTHIGGQVVFVDGGSELVVRGDRIW